MMRHATDFAAHSIRGLPGLGRACFLFAIAASLTCLGQVLPPGDLSVALDAPEVVWTSLGTAPWGAQSEVTHDGQDAARTGKISDGETSELQATIPGPGDVSFWWRASTETYFDVLKFRIDGADLGAISGQTGWQQRSFHIPAGSHVLSWVYSKDESGAGGEDCAWLDQVVLVLGPTVTQAPILLEVEVGDSVSLRVDARGGAPLAYRWNHDGVTLPWEQSFDMVINDVRLADAGDYAVTVSNAVGAVTATVGSLTISPQSIATLTNGLPRLRQQIGAVRSPTNALFGVRNVWRFFSLDNSLPPSELSGLTNGSNVAFITFPLATEPPAIGMESDIDLYVTRDPSITNLNPIAIQNAFKSLNQRGTEVVFFTNATLADVYYVAIKSEQRTASEFGIVALSTDEPFDEIDAGGNHILNGLPLALDIPDGSPGKPSMVYQFGVATTPITVGRMVVTNTFWHERSSDLYTQIRHGDAMVVLNDHSQSRNTPSEVQTVIYDDVVGAQFYGARRSDGPGSLERFAGQQAFGVPFILAMADNAQNQTGRVQGLKVRLEPSRFAKDSEFDSTISQGQCEYFVLNVPTDVSRLRILFANMSDKLNVYLRRDLLPTDTHYGKLALIDPPSGEVSIGLLDVPPLTAGRWFIGVYNPNATTVSYPYDQYSIKYLLERTVPTKLQQSVTSVGGPFPIVDEMTQRFSLLVTNARPVSSVSVGVRIDHPRATDLTLSLISPLGQRVLLAENRAGGLSTTGYGYGTLSNTVYAGFSDNTNLTALNGPIKFPTAPYGTNNVPTTNIISTFEGRGVTTGSHLAGTVLDGWDILTNVVAGITYSNLTIWTRRSGVVPDAHGGTNHLSLENGRIHRQLPTVSGRNYVLRFWKYGGSPVRPIQAELTLGDPASLLITNVLVETSEANWQLVTLPFAAPASGTPLEIRSSSEAPKMLLDDFDLIEFGGAKYYTPEEPLKPLVGQPGIGTWQLEVVDNRAGPTPAAPSLLSWQLNFIFAPTSPPTILLTNGIPYFGTVSGPAIQYFMVDVPRSTTIATNLLVPTSGGDLVLLYNESGLPDGRQAGDVVVDFFGAGSPDLLLLDRINPPKLRPGQRYYLGVANANSTEVNNFSIGVAFDRTDTNQPNVTILPIGEAYVGTVSSNEVRQFAVDVPLSARIASILLSPSGRGDLVLSFAETHPPSPFLGADIWVDAHGRGGRETLLLDAATAPRLVPGRRYYMAVSGAVVDGATDFNLSVIFAKDQPRLACRPAPESRAVELQLYGIPGGDWTIQTSSTLATWVDLVTIFEFSGSATVSDTIEGDGQSKFYRAVRR